MELVACLLLVLQVVFVLSGDGARCSSMVEHPLPRARAPRWSPCAFIPTLELVAADPDRKLEAIDVEARELGDRQRRMEALRSSRTGDFPSARGHLRIQGVCEGAAAARRWNVLLCVGGFALQRDLEKEVTEANVTCGYTKPLTVDSMEVDVGTGEVKMSACGYNDSSVGQKQHIRDLTDNQLSGSIPPRLLKRAEDGSLTLSNISSCHLTKKKSMLAVYVVAPLVVVVIIGFVLVLLVAIRKKQGKGSVEEQSEEHSRNRDSSSHLPLDNRRFTYRELEEITNNFHRVLGRGGFGVVYSGFLEDGSQVAVKLRSQTSSQGVTEFLAEARNLTRIHHKNLVSLVGYCNEGDYLALVYEHMSEGNLQDKLRGSNPNVGRLTWRQRLRIALESAQGLEYLHKSCSPPFLHRDVKTSNILLTANLKAKVADFGLLKAFNHEDDTHASTDRVVGTQGYLAPEYATALQLTEKSDVYSFGVVLLEVVTGLPPILQREPASIVNWVQQRLVQGNIENILDEGMRGNYEINSVWKATSVALICTDQDPAQRYTMTEVVAQLQECLELEESRTSARDPNSSYGTHNIHLSTNVGWSSWTSEMEHHFGKAPPTGPATR